MRKLISIILILIIILQIFLNVVCAEEQLPKLTLYLQADKAKATCGEEFTLSINLKSDSSVIPAGGISMIGIVLNYDPNTYEPILNNNSYVTKGDEIISGNIDFNNNEDNITMMYGSSGTAVSIISPGTFASIKFKVKDTAVNNIYSFSFGQNTFAFAGNTIDESRISFDLIKNTINLTVIGATERAPKNDKNSIPITTETTKTIVIDKPSSSNSSTGSHSNTSTGVKASPLVSISPHIPEETTKQEPKLLPVLCLEGALELQWLLLPNNEVSILYQGFLTFIRMRMVYAIDYRFENPRIVEFPFESIHIEDAK